MKYDFLSVSVALPEQRKADFFRAQFQPFLQVYPCNVLDFIQSDMIDKLVELLVERANFQHPHEEELFDQTTFYALEDVRKKYEKILADDRNATRSWFENGYFEEYEVGYLGALSNKLNEDLRHVSENLVDAALAVQDVSMARGNWAAVYLKASKVPEQEYYNYCFEKISKVMNLQTHEVSDFLYDGIFYDQYKEIVATLDHMPRKERKIFFDSFDEIIQEIQEHYIPIIEDKIYNQTMTMNDNDPAWKLLAEEMGPVIRTACMHITNAFIASRYSQVTPKTLYRNFVPS